MFDRQEGLSCVRWACLKQKIPGSIHGRLRNFCPQAIDGYSTQRSPGSEGLKMALLRRKRLVRFDTQVPTFAGWLEREILTQKRP